MGIPSKETREVGIPSACPAVGTLVGPSHRSPMFLLLPPGCSPDDTAAFARAAEWLSEGLEALSLSDAVADESSADSPDHPDRS
jgi:hypothetical protein